MIFAYRGRTSTLWTDLTEIHVLHACTLAKVHAHDIAKSSERHFTTLNNFKLLYRERGAVLTINGLMFICR